MNRVLTTLISFIFIAASVGDALAESGKSYFSFAVGSAHTNQWKNLPGKSVWDENPRGVSVAFAGGYRLNLSEIMLRSEFEVSINFMDDDRSLEETFVYEYDISYSQRTTTYMANFYVDFLRKYFVHPYIGIGFGVMNISETLDTEEGLWPNTYLNTSNKFVRSSYSTGNWYQKKFVWGPRAGVSWNMFVDSLELDIGLQYNNARISGADFEMFNIRGGIRWLY